MSQEPLNRPPRPDDPMFTQWIYQLWKRVASAGQIAWSQLTDVPANLSSIAGLTGSANQVLGKNAANNAYELKTIAAGSNVTVTHAAGSITIASSGGGGGTSGLPYYIDTTDSYTISANYQWLISGRLTNRGSLTVRGQLRIING